MDDDIIKETGVETEGADIAGTEDAAKIKEVTDALPDEDTLDELEELFKIFGDSTRIKILYALHIKEMCVMDISLALGMSQSAISHQLRVLRQTRLIRSRRDGKNIYYSLADEHVHTIISMGLEHIEE
ncbi:MAG: ArsR/SmtB family transcription factor [Eubacteriales bacterium]